MTSAKDNGGAAVVVRALVFGWAVMLVVGYTAHLIGRRLLVDVPFPATVMVGFAVVAVVLAFSMLAHVIGEALVNEERIWRGKRGRWGRKG